MNNVDKLLDATELARLQSLLPLGLRDKSENLAKFLEDYYRYMNTDGPSAVLNSLRASHDLYEMSDEYLASIQDEIAAYIPVAAKMDRRTLFKRIVKYFYNARGSRESANVFFKIFYNTECQITDPVSGSLISPLLTDQRHWLPYSYSIGVDVPVKEWEKPYRALVHPVGFRFYTADNGNTDSNGNNIASSLFILFSAINKWDKLKADAFIIENPDLTTSADIPYLYSYGKFQEFTADSYYLGTVDVNAYRYPASQPGWILPIPAVNILFETELGYLGIGHYDYDNMLKFYEQNVIIGNFSKYTILQASTIETGHNYTTAQLSNLGSYIFRSITTESQDDIITEDDIVLNTE
jgi:hypothetical protein